jgi:cysteinyl-tRNA synthetase
MRLSLALSLLLAQTASGFTIAPRVTPSALTTTSRTTTTTLLEKDEIDDWYADFDPSKFDESSTPSRSSSSTASPRTSAPPRSNDFVGAGTPHDYERDSSDSSNVNMDVVDRMMSQRLTARKTGQFEQADAIRDELLRDHGVMIRDKERTWRSGCSESGSGRNFSRGGRGGDRDGGRGGRGGGGAPRGRGKNFGPNGHDYNLSEDAGPSVSALPEPEIHRLMAERLQCKLSRDFQVADSIQEQLFSAGVMVHDARKEWRADGQSFGNDDNDFSKPGRERGSRADRNRPYEMSPESEEASDVEAIQALIAERVKAKMERVYSLADNIRDELRDMHNVMVDDRLRMWSVGGDFGTPSNTRAPPGPYMMSPASESPEDAGEVQRLVEARDQARADRDFSMADNIRDDLMERNIEIDDRTRQWAVGGRFANRPMGGGGPGGAFSRVGGGTLSEEDLELIDSLLVERDGYKRDREFGKADRIRDRLTDQFAVRIDDRSKEWHVVSNEYTPSQGSASLDDATHKYIEEQVNKRAVAKLNKDYEVADAIRDELMDDYQVSIDDRVKEWTALAAVGDSEVAVDANDVEVEIEGAADNNDDDEEEVEAPAPSANGSEDLKSLTVVELKERLRAAGLPVSGNKGELIERLVVQ